MDHVRHWKANEEKILLMDLQKEFSPSMSYSIAVIIIIYNAKNMHLTTFIY